MGWEKEVSVRNSESAQVGQLQPHHTLTFMSCAGAVSEIIRRRARGEYDATSRCELLVARERGRLGDYKLAMYSKLKGRERAGDTTGAGSFAVRFYKSLALYD